MMNMPNWLKQRAFLTPDRLALVWNEASWTFRQLFEEAARLAAAIEAAGVQKGDYCGVLASNRPETVFAVHALQQIGAAAVMLNSRLTAEEIDWQLQDAGAVYLLYDATTEQLADQLSFAASGCLTGWSSREPERPARPDFKLDEICSVMYTSGTTGQPKGVLHTYENHYASATASALNLGLHTEDAWLCAVPLFHIAGYSILMKSVLYGMEVRLFEKFDPVCVNQSLLAGEATMISVVSTMLHAMLDQVEEPYSPRLRCVLLGGGPAPLPLLEACRQKKIPVYQTYGMTETASQIVTLAPEDAVRKLGSAGKPLFPCAVKIESGPEGEILVSGPNVTKGYLNRPDAEEKAFAGHWFRTGDIGRLDEEGFLYVLDRRSDLIISGGENVYPAEVESVLAGHPFVQEAGVIGVPHAKWGQVPAAFYVSTQALGKEELAAYCREKLAGYKIPAFFQPVAELPRNAAHKLLRRKLAEEWRKSFER